VRTELLTPFVEISRGGQATVQVEVYNTGSIIDGVTVRVAGLDPSWVHLPIAVTSLFPDTSETIDIELHLPKTYPAGRHTIAFEVRSTVDSTDGAIHHVVLDVAPAEDAQLEVNPRRVVGKSKTTVRAEVENRGNRPIELTVTAADSARELSATVEPPTLTVQPGQTSTALVQLKGKRPFYGTPAMRQISIQAVGGEHHLEATTNFTQKPRVGRGIITILTLVGIVALWAVVFTVAINKFTDDGQQYKTLATSFDTGAVDIDNDGIIDALGTDDKADIDVASVAGTIGGALIAETTKVGIPRLTIEAYRDTREGPRLVASIATDDSGAYELAGLLPGVYRLRFTGPGFEERWFPAASSQGGAEPITLEPTAELELAASIVGNPGSMVGTVLTDALEGATAASVTITVRENELAFETSTTANPDGTFVVTDLPTPGNFEITYSSPEFRSRNVIEPLDGGQNKTLNTIKLVAADGSISGIVRDENINLGGVTVTLSRGDTIIQTTTPTSGAQLGSYLFAELETPGTYVITFELDGYATETQAVDLAPGESETNFDALLIGGAGQISGRALDTGGNPISGVTVTVSGGGFFGTAATLSAGLPGSYTVGEIPTPGDYTVTFVLPGYRTETRFISLTSGGPAEGVDIILQRSFSSVEGVVTVAALPTGGLEVTLSNGTISLSTTTESGTGRYRFADLTSGSYTVSVQPSDPNDSPFVRLVQVAAGILVPVNVDL